MIDAGAEVDADGVQQRRLHLAGQGAFPDQLVEAELVLAEKALEFGRRALGQRGSNRLVRFLGILALGAVAVRLLGQEGSPVKLRDGGPQIGDRVVVDGRRAAARPVEFRPRL